MSARAKPSKRPARRSARPRRPARAPKRHDQAIADAVQAAIVARKMSAADLARKSGVPRPALTRWFRGERGILSDNIGRVFKALGLTVTTSPKKRK